MLMDLGGAVRQGVPQVGYGNEWVFQAPNSTTLNTFVAAAASRLGRYPGGTPSGFWDWRVGWEVYPWDHTMHSYCPTTLVQLATHLAHVSDQVADSVAWVPTV